MEYKAFLKNCLLLMVAVGCFAMGFWTAGRWHAAKPAPAQVSAAQAAETIWTCSMHPQIRENKPGKCRICAMDLIPVESEEIGRAHV